MKRIDYATFVLRESCSRFDKKHPTKIPYFVIYIVPMENKEALRIKMRHAQIMRVQEEPDSDRAFKSVKTKMGIIDQDGKQWTTVTGKRREVRMRYVVKNREEGGVGKIIKKEEKDSITTWNIYDSLEEPLYGEIHDVDEIPDTNVVRVNLESKVPSVQVSNLYLKHKSERVNSIYALDYHKTKGSSEQDLNELAVEISQQHFITKPLIYVDSSIIGTPSHEISKTHITREDHKRDITTEGSRIRQKIRKSAMHFGYEILFDYDEITSIKKLFESPEQKLKPLEVIMADPPDSKIDPVKDQETLRLMDDVCGGVRRAIALSMELQGVPVIINKENEVTLLNRESVVADLSRRLKKMLPDPYEGDAPQSEDEYEQDSDDFE
jgi:hypothetical protein